MGQVVVTFKDLDDDRIDVQLEFDPPVSKDSKLTPAQAFGVSVLDAAADNSGAEVKHV
jgi:hypothetical protein